MRKVLMVAIGAAVLAAAALILMWRPGDEQALLDAPPGPHAPAGSQYVAPLPVPSSAPPLGQDVPGGGPDPAPEAPGSAPEAAPMPSDEAETPDFREVLPEYMPPDEAETSGLPEVPPDSMDDGLEGFPKTFPESIPEFPLVVPWEETDDALPADSRPDGVPHISGVFFDDLAGQIVAGYLPPRSEFNPESQGRLRFHFSTLNRRYGMDLVGLEHQSPTLIQGREEIFRNLLRPEVLETIWMLFVPVFEQALEEALQSTRWSFHVAGASPVERGLTNQEQQEFYRLLSASAAALAQAVQGYVDRGDALPLTERWLQAQTMAYAAHSRYQLAETELRTAQEEAPEDKVRILAERLERDAAAQGIMQAIAGREQARGELLRIYIAGRSGPDLGEPELIYLAEWLYRRTHAHPQRSESIRHIADKLRELSLRLHPGG